MRPTTPLEQAVAKVVHQLPPVPENIARLTHASSARAEDRAEIVRLIANDPGLCAELLHLANTCYGTGTRIETIEDAVANMGVEPLIQFIGTAYVNETLRQEFAALTHLNDYFAHSREISRAVRLLADLTGLPQHVRQMYSVAGLIHDLGRLVIMIAAGKTSAPLMGTSCDQMTTLIHSEQDVLGMNHCVVGREVCRNWSFSPDLQEGVLRHHTPLVNDDFSYPGALIFLAHFVAGSDFTGEIIAGILPPAIFDRFGLTTGNFDTARARYQTASQSQR